MAKFRASLWASSNQSSFGTAASVPPSVPAGAVPPEVLVGGASDGSAHSSQEDGLAAIEDIDEYSESEYDDAPLSSRSKSRTSAAKASAGASLPTPAPTSALRVSHRDTKTSEIKRFGKQPPPRKPISSQPKSLSRKGAKIPYAPKSKTDWGDVRTIARALTQLHPLPHLLGNSAELAEEAAYGLAASGTRGSTLTVSELTDQLMRVLRTSQALYLDDAVPPAGRRYPLPPMGIGGHPTLDDVPISALSLSTLASTDPRMLTRYYTSHGIICDYLDFSRLPPNVFTSTKAYSDEAWYETVLRAHRFVSELFLMGGAHSRPQPPALRVILVAYTSSHMPVSSIHPDDAALFLRGLFPGCFATNVAAADFLRGLTVFAHFYNFVCEDFLYRFFPGLLLGIFEFWMEENFAQEFELDRVVRYTTAGDQYDDQVQTVIARARVLGKGYMPLDRMIFNEDNEHAMLHLGSHYPHLLVMFPTYYEAMQGVKVQMFLTFFYLSHPPDLLALDFYIYMACHGGLYPDPVGAPPLVSSVSTLLAPCANHAWSLLKVRTPAPPTFLLGNAPRPALHDADAFSIYIGEMAKVQLTDSDRADAYERFEARDSIEPPLLSEHSFDVADGPIDTSPASSRKFISPQPFSHPCFAAIQGVKPLPVTEAAARFHAGVQQYLSAQPQVDFHLPAAWTAQLPAPRSEPVVVDIAAQEDAQRTDLSSPTPLDRQASPSAIGWELDHAPSQHHHFTDDTFAFSAGSGSDPEQGVDAPYPAPAFNAASNPMSMASGGQFVTRCARGLTSHSTVSSNIVPDLYPVPLDCLLPRMQPPIYGCTSAASIRALPPHIKFNLTALQQEVHQRLQASSTAVPAAPELRYTIPGHGGEHLPRGGSHSYSPVKQALRATCRAPALCTGPQFYRRLCSRTGLTSSHPRRALAYEGYWDGGTEYVPDDFCSARRTHTHEGPEGDVPAYPARDRSFDDFLPTFYGRTDTQPDTPLPDRSLGLTYPILINSYAVAEYVVVSVTPEVAPVPYVTAGSRGGILLANPSLLCASTEHPCLVGYDAPFRPSFIGPDPLSASDPSGPYVPIAKRKAAPSPAPSSDSSAASSSHSSDTSGSSERGTRTLTDVAGREVLRGSGTTQQLVRMTDQVRTLAPDVHIARILQGPDDGPNVRDPSFYQTPPMVTCLWYVQRESNPTVALKACLFIFALSRNWQPDSLRLFHFLPEGRAAALASTRFKGTWQVWIDALRGLAATYSALFDTSYGTAFLDMVNLAYAQQAGQAYTSAYLEASLNDMLFRFFDAARNPTIPVQLPGASKLAGLMLIGFRALVEELRSPARFQAYTFRMESQPRTHYPLYRTTKMDRAEGDDERRRPPPAPAARPDARTCFFNVLREYKVPLKSGDLPKQCDDKCRRLHFAQMPKGSCRTSLLQLAANTSLVSEDNRETLIAKITADKRIKLAAGGAATLPSPTLTARPPLPLLPSDLACIASTLHQVNTFASVLNLHTSLDQQTLDDILTEAFIAASGNRLHSTFGTAGTLVPGLDPFDFVHLVVVATEGIKLHLPAGFTPTSTPPPLRNKYVQHWAQNKGKPQGRPICDVSQPSLDGGPPLNGIALGTKAELRLFIQEFWDPIDQPTLTLLMLMVLRAVELYGWDNIILWKKDLQGAFTLLWFRPADAHLLAFPLTDNIVAFHLAGMFGWVGMPFVFQVFTRALIALVAHVILGLCSMYVDDIMAVSTLADVDRDMTRTDAVINGLLGPQAIAKHKDESSFAVRKPTVLTGYDASLTNIS
ncbi:hypothetical protein B484DRAFT_396717, partial [Ochromonadaceae sp. CCMP2298]